MAIHDDLERAQFENVNALRAYPFREDGARIDRNGRELSGDVLVDAHFVVPKVLPNPESGIAQENLPGIRMTSAHLSPTLVSICFLADCEPRPQALSVTVARRNFLPYVPYRLEKLTGCEDIGGIVTFGEIAFPGFPETYFFDNAPIHPCCIAVAHPPNVRKFVDPRSGESVSGDAEIAFSGYVEQRKIGNAFALALEKRAEAELASRCAQANGKDVCGATPIISINGIRPDKDGNIVLWFH